MHRWRIDEPNGAVSAARCSLCGAEKAMSNVWEGDREMHPGNWKSQTMGITQRGGSTKGGDWSSKRGRKR